MLHISDVHFKSPDCLDSWMDPDAPVRTRMMRDLTEQVQKQGQIDAILIGGDVAFKAAPDEYQTARACVQQLAQILGCSKERIFVVPGSRSGKIAMWLGCSAAAVKMARTVAVMGISVFQRSAG